MEYVAIIISIISLVGAGFAFIRANSSHNIMVKRVEALKEKNNMLDARLRKFEGNAGRGNRPANELNEGGRRKKQRPEEQEERQNKPRQERQNEPRQKQPRPEQQPEQRQEPRERQQQPRQQQQPNQQVEEGAQQPRRRRENRRRNEPMDRSNYQEVGEEQPLQQRSSPPLEFTQGGLLDELEQSAATPAPIQSAPAVVDSGTRYAIIPEDGVIRAHQLQQQPDSDSYIEVDVPADGGHITKYRFNLAGNHAFVIAQGIDRLENAFDFEKPSNRMVSKVVQQQDGVLTRVGNGWRIHEKARIDFR